MAGFLARLWTGFAIRCMQFFWSGVVMMGLVWRWLTVGSSLYTTKDHKLPDKLLKYNHKYIELPSGIRMHYVEEGDENAPMMVFVHGYPEFWYTWRYQIDHFKKNFRVVAIDQRGYGDSDKPKECAAYHIDLLARDLDLLIHALGYEKAVVVGHDWGGAVVWRHALHYPSSVERLIVMNCPHPAVFGDMLKTHPEQMKKSWYVFMFQTPYLPEYVIAAEDYKMLQQMFWGKNGGMRNKGNMTEEDMEAWKYTFSRPGALTPPLNYYRCSIQYPVGGKQREKCKPKTLIIWGDGDAFLVKEGGVQSPKWCEDGRVEFLEGASHWVQQDVPDRVNELMQDFLADLPRPIPHSPKENNPHL